MAIEAEYSSVEARILDAGRALESALSSGNRLYVEVAAQELLRVGTAREELPAVANFRDGVAAAEGGTAPGHPDEALAQILSELEIGQTLLTAGAAVEDDAPTAKSRGSLGMALTDLEVDRQRRMVSSPTVNWFRDTAADTPPLEELHADLDACLQQVVMGTTSVTLDAVKGLGSLPASIVQPWLTSAGSLIGEIPKIGSLATLGLKAIRRAVNALLHLVPEPLRDKIAELAGQWWSDSGVTGVVERLLAVGDARNHADSVLTEELADASAREGAAAIRGLTELHQRSTATIRRVLKVLSTLIGPLAASFTAAAAWLYGAAAVGYGGGVCASFWIGRDVLDTGAGWERLEGVQVILARIAT